MTRTITICTILQYLNDIKDIKYLNGHRLDINIQSIIIDRPTENFTFKRDCLKNVTVYSQSILLNN